MRLTRVRCTWKLDKIHILRGMGWLVGNYLYHISEPLLYRTTMAHVLERISCCCTRKSSHLKMKKKVYARDNYSGAEKPPMKCQSNEIYVRNSSVDIHTA